MKINNSGEFIGTVLRATLFGSLIYMGGCNWYLSVAGAYWSIFWTEGK